MKAFVMKEIGSVGFIEKPVPSPGPNDHEAVGVVSDVGSEVKVLITF